MRRTHPKLSRVSLAIPMALILWACDKPSGDAEPEGEGRASAAQTEQAEGSAEGVSQSAAPRGHVDLTLWHSYRRDEEQALNQVVDLWNRTHEDTTIEALAIPFDAYPDRITAAIPRGRGPDLFIFAHDRIGGWDEERIIEPINFWTDDALLEQFFETTVRSLVYRRRLFGLPLAYKSVVLFYNPEQVPNPPTTTDELIQMAGALTGMEDGEERYGLVYQFGLLYFHAPWLHGFGGRVVDEDGRLAVAEDGAFEAMRFAQSLYRTHNLLPENVFSQSVVSLFNSGRAAIVISGPWFRGELSDEANWAVAPLPTVSATGQPARPFLTTEAVMLSAHGAHKERSFEAARWLATDPEAVRIRMNVGHQPVALRSAYEEGGLEPSMAVFRDQMLNSVPTPNTPLMRRIWGHYDTALFNAVKNGADAAEVLRTAHERIQNE